jgi:hypothetical protein
MMQQDAINQCSHMSKLQVQHDQVQLSLSKPIIRPWEEINDNKNRPGLVYDKEVTFHTVNYSKSIQFQSVGFLQEVLTSPVRIEH